MEATKRMGREVASVRKSSYDFNVICQADKCVLPFWSLCIAMIDEYKANIATSKLANVLEATATRVTRFDKQEISRDGERWTSWRFFWHHLSGSRLCLFYAGIANDRGSRHRNRDDLSFSSHEFAAFTLRLDHVPPATKVSNLSSILGSEVRG